MAQLPVVPLQVFKSSSAVTPTSVPGIRYWWRFEDAAATNASVVSWLDRIVSFPLTNSTAGLRPTNSSNGVGFNGSTWLTNTQPFGVTCGAAGCGSFSIGTATNGSLFVIMQTHGAGTQGIACNDNTGGQGLFTAATRQIEWFGGNTLDFGNYALDTPIDIVCCLTNSGSVVSTFYTNGVVAGTVTLAPVAQKELVYGAANNAGSSMQLFFNGKITDIAYYTNYLTAAQASTLHTYAQTRGVSP